MRGVASSLARGEFLDYGSGITCFDVLEHVPDPLVRGARALTSSLKAMASRSPSRAA